MIEIEGIGGRPATQRTAGRSRTTATFFVSPGTSGGEAPSSAAPTGGVPQTSMLALQEVGVETVQDREARRHGSNILAELALLQRALLAGGDTSDALQRLAELAEAVPHASDPRLTAIVSAILLRARVELARRQQ